MRFAFKGWFKVARQINLIWVMKSFLKLKIKFEKVLTVY